MVARRTPKSRKIKASEFKVKCLALIDEVGRTGESVVITRNGKPIAELSPYKQRKRNARGILKGRLVVTGDIISPVGIPDPSLNRITGSGLPG
jgi:prevent-host-death family protein